MKEKIIFSLICIGLIVGFITGCGNNSNKKSEEINHKDNENMPEIINWTTLVMIINENRYKYPYKISDFINNGWDTQSTEFNDIINGTINNAITNGYNYISIKQKNIKINAYFDTTNTNDKVLNSTIIRLEIESLNDDNNSLDFYGIKFGSNKEEIEKVFGTKNYEILSDNSNYTYHYFSKTLDDKNITLELQINKTKNKLEKLSINIY